MDDAQGIVLLALQRAGVELPEDVHSVGDLRPQQLVPIYAHALALIRGSPVPGLPTDFPKQQAERFRMCADLVAAFQQLGYRGELSFHQASAFHMSLLLCPLAHWVLPSVCMWSL
jgi:hypothetical protein